MYSKLDKIRSENPNYFALKSDDEILTERYNQYYKDKFNISYEDYKSKMIKPQTIEEINQQARKQINDINNLTKEDFEKYSNYLYNTKKAKWENEATFWNGIKSSNLIEAIPFISGLQEGSEAKHIRNLIERARNNYVLSRKEEEELNEYFDKANENAIKSEASVGYRIGRGTAKNFSFIGEFAIANILTGGTASIAKATTLGAKVLAGAKAAGINTLFQPTSVYARYQARQLSGELQITDKGKEFFNDNKSKFSVKNLLKSYMDVYVSNITELVGGELIAPITNPLTDLVNPILKKAAKNVFNDSVANVVRKLGWNGFIEEVFEEWLENPLRQVLGLEDNEYTWQNFLNSLKMSEEQFLETIGAVVVQGGISFGAAKLYNTLVKKGMNPVRALSILNTSTEKQIENYNKQISDFETNDDINNYNTKLNNLKQQGLSAGRTEEEMDSQIKLIDNVITKYGVDLGLSRNAVFNRYSLAVQKAESNAGMIEPTMKDSLSAAQDIERFYQERPEIYTNINEVLELSKKDGTFNKKYEIGKVSNWLVEEAKKNNLDIKGYIHDIDVSAIKHINKDHGDNKIEKPRGQVAITDDDIKNIPYIIENADYVIFGTKNKLKQDGVVYVKNLNDGTTIYIEEKRSGKKTLTANTMWKMKTSITPQSLVNNIINHLPDINDRSLLKIIENPNQKVKKNETLNQSATPSLLGQIELGNESALITLFENANKSTLLHETGHYFLKLTEVMAEAGSSIAKKELESIRKFLKNDGGNFMQEQNELFARSFEAYLRRGIAPNKGLKSVFERFKEWLTEVYKNIKQLNIGNGLSSEVIEFFDKYLNTDIETDVETDYKLKQEQEQLQNEIDKEREVLYQEGLSEEEVESKIDEKYGERIKKIEEQIKSSKKKSKDYDFKKYMVNMELAKQQEKTEASKRRKKSTMEFFRNSFKTTDSILKEIDENLYYRWQKFYAESSVLEYENKKTIENFENIFKSIYDNSKEDYYRLDRALKNRFMDEVQEIINKYNDADNNFYNSYLKVRELLDRLRDEAVELGVDVGYIENYFPREVDYRYRDDFLDTLRKDNQGVYNDLMYNLQQLRKESNVFGPDDEVKFINNYLRGFIPKNLILLTANNNLRKPRELENITPELAKFFVPSEVALKDYVENIQKDILRRRLFGMEDVETRDKRNKIKRLDRQLTNVIATSAGKIKANQEYKLEFEKKAAELNLTRFSALLEKERLNQQINFNNPQYESKITEYEGIIEELKQKISDLSSKIEQLKTTNENVIKNIRIKEIREEIQTLQEEIGVSETLENSIAKYVENIPNLTTEKQKLLKRVITAIMNPAATGIGSKFWSWSGSLLALNSVKNAINQLPELANSMYKNGFIHTVEAITNKKDITLNELGIEDVLQDITLNPSGFANKMLKWTGFEAIDSFGKNVYLNSTLLKVKEDLRNNDVKTIKEIEKIFGNDAEQVQDDLKSGNMSRLAKEYLFIKLAEIQPLTLGSKTLTYLENGASRWTYALKSYMIKQLDVIHNDIIKEFKNGNNEVAFKNLIRMQAFLLMIGASKDLVMGMFFGYDDDDDFIDLITDAVLDNIIGVNIVSRYTLERAGKKGLGTATSDYLFGAPVISLFDDIQKDIQNIIDGKMDFDKWRTLRYIPFGKDIKNVKKATDNK